MSAGTLTIHAQARETKGKGPAYRNRAAGKLPAVIYGAKKDPRSIVMDRHEFNLIRQKTHGDQLLLKVELGDGTAENVFIKDIQRDPVTSEILHADLLRVDMAKKITLSVKVIVVGQLPVAVKEGGLLERHHDRVQVNALPGDMPAHIEVDLSGMAEDSALHISELPALKGVEYVEDPHTVVISVISKARAAKAAEEREKVLEANAAEAAANAAAAAAAIAAAAPAGDAKDKGGDKDKKDKK